MSEVVPKKVITGFDIYFDPNFEEKDSRGQLTPQAKFLQNSFDKQLKKLINFVFTRYDVDCIPLAEFHDFCRDKFRKRMKEDIKYDPAKCKSFATYLHTIFRNESTRVKKKYGKNYSFVDYFSDKEKQEVSYKTNDDIIDFVNKLRSLGIMDLDFELLESDIHIKFLTPLTFSFFWLKNSNRL
jgi:hypothetical protein